MANDMGNIQVGIEFNMVGGRDVVKVTNDVRRFEKEMLKLTQAQRAGAISNRAYQKGVAQLTQRLQKNTGEMIKATKYASQFRKTLAQLDDATLMAARAQNQFGVIASQNTQRFKRFSSVGLQQVGYQVGDFAVQVQGGTNAMVALGQQGSQLLGIFGPMGAVAGAALAIFTAMGAPLLDSAFGAKSFSDALDELDTQLSKMDDHIDRVEELGESFDRVNNAVIRLQGTLAKQDLGDAIEKAIDPATTEGIFENLWATFKRGEQIVTGGFTPIDTRTALEQLGLDGIQYGEQFFKDFQRGVENMDFNQIDVQLDILLDEINEVHGSLAMAPPEVQKLFTEMVRATQEARRIRSESEEAEKVIRAGGKAAAELAEEIGQGAVDALKLAGVDLESGIDAAAKRAAQLASNLSVSLATAEGIINLRENKVYSGRGSGQAYGFGNAPGEFAPSQEVKDRAKELLSGVTTGRRGGGGAGPNLEPMREQFSKLMDRLRGVDPLITKYNQEMAKLDEWHKKGAISSEQLANAQKLLGQELEKNLDPLKKFKDQLAETLDPEANHMKGLEALNNALADFIFDPFENGVKGMVLQFSDAMRRMASEAIAAHIMQSFIKSPLGGIFGGIFANGAVFSGGRVTPFASGGVVNGPTVFPMANGMGLMGEAGPEAVMPLKRDKSGRLGVEAQGAQMEAPQIKVVNIDDRASIGEYLEGPAGEKVVMNVLRRNGIVNR